MSSLLRGGRSRAGEPAASAATYSRPAPISAPLPSSITIVPSSPVTDERDQVGVGEHVLQLVLGVPVVDVDGDRTKLAAGQDRLGGLDGVVCVEPDVLPGLDPEAGQIVRQAVGPLIQLAVGDLLVR